MDEKWVGAHNTRKFGDVFKNDLPMKPSEYVDRNCFFAASTPGRRRDRAPPRRSASATCCGATTCPHPEGTYPHTRYWIAERFRDVPEDEAAQILGRNAAAVYRVDSAAARRDRRPHRPVAGDVHG